MRIFVARQYAERLIQEIQPRPAVANLLGIAEPGIQVMVHDQFPYWAPCSPCRSSGFGTESTYCHFCKGQGGRRVIGTYERDGQIAMIHEPVPKKPVPFPRDVHVPLPRIRIVI